MGGAGGEMRFDSLCARVVRIPGSLIVDYRDGKQVKSDCVPAGSFDEISRKIERRKSLVAAIREQKRSQKQIIRALGRTPEVN